MERILAIASAVTVLVQVLRRAPGLRALWQRIPDGWRWLPAMLLAGLGTWAERTVGGAPQDVAITSAVELSVVIGLAAMGIRATASEGKQLASLAVRLVGSFRKGGGGGALLLVLVLAGGGGLIACARPPEPCSQEALDVEVAACTAAITNAPEGKREAIATGCHAAVDAWLLKCGGGGGL